MATLYGLTCPACSYTATVAGGRDMTMCAVTVTISCATCRELMEAVLSDDPGAQPAPPTPDHPTCPRSRTRVHRTALWAEPGPCPKCGAIMERNGSMALAD